jgi:PPOX class probable F420-dependent enzyme
VTLLSEPQQRLLDENDHGVIATQGPEGRPRQSVVYYVRDGERLLISTLADRAKARDVRRTGWASLSVSGAERPHPSATFSGPAEIVTERIGEPTARIMQRISGAEEPPEAMSDEALAEVDRVILAITVERVAAVNYIAAGERPDAQD